jgi:hypothetical protein
MTNTALNRLQVVATTITAFLLCMGAVWGMITVAESDDLSPDEVVTTLEYRARQDALETQLRLIHERISEVRDQIKELNRK